MALEAVCGELCCPMTGELFVEPVIFLDDGATYEKSAVEQWLASLPCLGLGGADVAARLVTGTRYAKEAAEMENNIHRMEQQAKGLEFKGKQDEAERVILEARAKAETFKAIQAKREKEMAGSLESKEKEAARECEIAAELFAERDAEAQEEQANSRLRHRPDVRARGFDIPHHPLRGLRPTPRPAPERAEHARGVGPPRPSSKGPGSTASPRTTPADPRLMRRTPSSRAHSLG